MVILIDTNIILDHFIPRQPFADNASDILTLCFNEKCNGYIAAHSVPNISDFSLSPIPAILPEDFLQMMSATI